MLIRNKIDLIKDIYSCLEDEEWSEQGYHLQCLCCGGIKPNINHPLSLKEALKNQGYNEIHGHNISCKKYILLSDVKEFIKLQNEFEDDYE